MTKTSIYRLWKKKSVVYSNLAYTKGFLKPLPTMPNSLAF